MLHKGSYRLGTGEQVPEWGMSHPLVYLFPGRGLGRSERSHFCVQFTDVLGECDLKGPFAFFLVITPDIFKLLGSYDSSGYPLSYRVWKSGFHQEVTE